MRQMKDSGVDWIGEIPEDWNIVQTKRCFRYNKHVAGSNAVDYDRLALTLSGIIKRSKEDSEGLQPVKFEGYQIIQENNLVFKLIDLENVKTSRVGLSPYKGLISPAYIVLNNESKDNRFYYYWFMSMYYNEVFNHLGGDGVRSALNAKDVLNLPVPLMDYKKQFCISNYLDKKFAEIDNIIKKQKLLIEKLKEYKLSIITEAVTKGLNLTVEMKESGIEFIGMIPKSWKTCRLRNIGKFQNGISKSGDFFGRGCPFVSYSDVYRNYSLPRKVDYLIDTTEEERKNYSVQKGDIFFTRTSETIEEVGLSAVCEETIPNATFAGFVIRVRPFNNMLLTKYAKYYFRSNHHRFYLAKAMNLVTRASLGQDLLKSMPVLIPPKEEQFVIANFLDEKCTAIESAITKKQKIIDRLMVYKKSFIYEVITGKKDIDKSYINDNEERIAYVKSLLMCRIIDLAGSNLKGRIYLQKCIFVIECMAGLNLNTQYVRYEHGPYDENLKKYEKRMAGEKWVSVNYGKQTKYMKDSKFNEYYKLYQKVYSKNDDIVKKVVRFLSTMKTHETERVATLLAVWNDFIIDGIQNPTDMQLINEVKTHWTENKANSSDGTWKNTLMKMKKAQIIPHGYGKHTKQRNFGEA